MRMRKMILRRRRRRRRRGGRCWLLLLLMMMMMMMMMVMMMMMMTLCPTSFLTGCPPLESLVLLTCHAGRQAVEIGVRYCLVRTKIDTAITARRRREPPGTSDFVTFEVRPPWTDHSCGIIPRRSWCTAFVWRTKSFDVHHQRLSTITRRRTHSAVVFHRVSGRTHTGTSSGISRGRGWR
jgi:hypothetical protein